MKRRELIKLGAGVAILGSFPRLHAAAPAPHPSPDWYERSFYLYHLDHHTQGRVAVGAEADPAVTDRLLALHKPDVIQTHAKGNPGWTTYPSKVGHTPPKLARDVLGMWRDEARKRGYAWSIYYNFGRDGEIQIRKPEWNRIDAGGKLREHALCYHSGVMEGYILPMIDEIMAGYDPDAFWFDGSCFTVATCYCAKCRERFKRETGLKMPANAKQPGWDEFKEMHRRIYREACAQLCEHIHQKNPKCRVAVNWAWSLHMPEAPPAGISHLTGDTGNNVERLSVEGHWYDAQGLPFDLMTTIHVRTKDHELIPKPAPQIQQEMAIIIANGGRYHAWDVPTPESGLSEERHRHLGQAVAPFLRARQEFCLGSERVPAVSLLFTSTAHYASTRNSPVCFPGAAGTSPALNGAADTLTRMHLDYEIISRERLLRGEIKTKYLIAEDPAAARGDEVAAMRSFMEGGGTLLLTGNGCALNGLKEEVARASSPVMLDPNTPLMQREMGQGCLLAIASPVLSATAKVPADVINSLFDILIPPAARPIVTDAPETVELVLWRRGPVYVLHMVNRAPGNRVPAEVPQQKWLITEIPKTAQFQIKLRVPLSRHVEFRPDGPSDVLYSYKDGVLNVSVMPFDIHQMIVIGIEK